MKLKINQYLLMMLFCKLQDNFVVQRWRFAKCRAALLRDNVVLQIAGLLRCATMAFCKLQDYFVGRRWRFANCRAALLRNNGVFSKKLYNHINIYQYA